MLVAITLIVHLVPLALLALLVWRPMSRLGFGSTLLLAMSYHACLHHLGVWYWLGLHTRWAVWALFPLSLLRVWHLGIQARWFPRSWWRRAGVLLGLSGSVLWLAGSVEALRARTVPADAVSVHWPLQPGAYAIVHGGVTETTNHHHPVSAQRFAWDVVRVNALGARARGLSPSALSDYYTFGTQVLSPCAGQVVSLVNDRQDNVPGRFDEQAPAGNFVAIHCAAPQDITVVLAHLEQGSVQTALGDRLAVGALIARIGNSGNTTEPHLHIHAVQGRVTELEPLLFTGQAVPLRVGDVFPVRNDHLVFLDTAAPR
jgi:hypothetical protein